MKELADKRHPVKYADKEWKKIFQIKYIPNIVWGILILNNRLLI